MTSPSFMYIQYLCIYTPCNIDLPIIIVNMYQDNTYMHVYYVCVHQFTWNRVLTTHCGISNSIIERHNNYRFNWIGIDNSKCMLPFYPVKNTLYVRPFKNFLYLLMMYHDICLMCTDN